MARFVVDPGKAAEYLFAYKCLLYNYMVLWPSSQTVPYDVMVDTGEDQIRVQVKATYSKDTAKDRFGITLMKSNGEAYTKDDCDIIACYIAHTNTWYICPISAVQGIKSINVYPHREETGQYESFKEAWNLLKAK